MNRTFVGVALATVVATGLSRNGQRARPPIQVVQTQLRTGTDNVPFNVPTMSSAVGVQNTAPATVCP